MKIASTNRTSWPARCFVTLFLYESFWIRQWFGRFLGQLHEFINAGRATKLIGFTIHNPGKVRVRLGLGNRANLVPLLWEHVVGRLESPELGRRRDAAIGDDITRRVLAAGCQLEGTRFVVRVPRA